MPTRPKRQRLQKERDMQPSVLDGRSRIRKQESLDPDEDPVPVFDLVAVTVYNLQTSFSNVQELSTAVPAVHEAEVMSGGCTDQDETIDIGPGPYDAFKSCHVSCFFSVNSGSHSNFYCRMYRRHRY
uniref:Zgc: n=1 Tax=Ascaris lumbricoides TaxID=6252 RepID=A0A0M3HZV7_ASCLU